MNKIYKIIWSKAKNCFVVASELAKNHTKSPCSAVVGSEFEDNIMLSLCNSAVCSPVFSTGFIQPVKVNQVGSLPNVENYDFKITVAAIVKNEAKNVPTWVKAARSCADEIVVVDTGSTDGTVERFAEYGIECYHYEWQDDFAAAKNYMISLCHGDWIVLLDGDEWFREDCNVRKAIAKHHGNPIVKAIISDWICLDTTRNNTIMFSGGAVRAFRNQPDVRYFRKVHENLTIQYENFVFEPELKLYHTGYSGDVNRSKHERNLRIMRTMFDFDNGKVEFPTDWRYVQDTYAGLGDFEKSLWASDKMLEFNVPDYSAASWITRFNVLFAMKTDIERMKKEFEYCFKTVPTVSGFRFLAAIYYIRHNMVPEGLNQYIEGMRMLTGPQDKVAMEHSYWRMYMPEASALVSAVYLRNQKYEAALYACKVCEAYCGKTNWTNMAFADIYRVLPSFYGISTFDIRSNFLNLFNTAKKGILAAALISTLLLSMANDTFAASCVLNGSGCASGTNATVTGGSENRATGNYSSASGGDCNTASGCYSFVGGGECNTASGDVSTVVGGLYNVSDSYYSLVAGGSGNTANSHSSTVVGGACNTASGETSLVVGGFCNNADGVDSVAVGGCNGVAYANFSTVIGGGIAGNASCVLAAQHSVAIGHGAVTTKDYEVTVGSSCTPVTIGGNLSVNGTNTVSDGTTTVNWSDLLSAAGGGSTSVLPGCNNTVSGCYAYISGGCGNITSGCVSSISGGQNNVAGCYYSYENDQYRVSFVSPTCSDVTFNSDYTQVTVGNKTYNLTSYSGDSSSVLGGSNNLAVGVNSAVGGGHCNVASGNDSFTAGGSCNIASACYSTAVGGIDNESRGLNATVIGGCHNVAGQYYSYLDVANDIVMISPHSTDYTFNNNDTVTIPGVGTRPLTSYNGNYAVVLGGGDNVAAGDYSSVSGGRQNYAYEEFAHVSGGFYNHASGCYSAILGGDSNFATGCQSTVVGGCQNNASGYYATVSGGTSNKASGEASYAAGGGGNEASGNFSTVIGSYESTVTGTAALILGGETNSASGFVSTAIGGCINSASGCYSTVMGGCLNAACAKQSTAVGGVCNIASGCSATAVGGACNIAGVYYSYTTDAGNTVYVSPSCTAISNDKTTITVGSKTYSLTKYNGDYASVFGGQDNKAIGNYSVASAGCQNMAVGEYSSTSAGKLNVALGCYSSVTAGEGNLAYAVNSSVSGGSCNTAGGETSSVSGGVYNRASGVASSVSGGICNVASGCYASVLGGEENEAQGGNSSVTAGLANMAFGDYSSVTGGAANQASCSFASISAGGENLATGYGSSISGGYANTSSGCFTSVTSGRCNVASCSYSSVSGGTCNTASGCYSSVTGGQCNTAGQYYTYERYTDWVLFVSPSCSDIHDGKITVNGQDYDLTLHNGDYATVSGGRSNLAIGEGSAVAGGTFNVACGTDSAAFGGFENYAFGGDSTVVGGMSNRADGDWSLIAGGTMNRANCELSSVFGGHDNVADAEYTAILGGYCNTANCTYAVAVGGSGNQASGEMSLTLGGNQSIAYANDSVAIGGGITGNASCAQTAKNSVAIGTGAVTTRDYEVIIGSSCAPVTIGGNLTIDNTKTISDGTTTVTWGDVLSAAGGGSASVLPGCNNTASGCYSYVSGGACNTASGGCSSISGGNSNQTNALYTSITAGCNNLAGRWGYYFEGNPAVLKFTNPTNTSVNENPVIATVGEYASVHGGACNYALGNNSSILGGTQNAAIGQYSTISGGQCNAALGSYSNIVGGTCNTAKADQSVMIGGNCNISDHYYYYFDEHDYAQTIPAECAVIIGHCVQVGNKTYYAFDAPACNSVSVGGQWNKVSGNSSVIVAGGCNLNVGYNSGIVGGSFNVTSGSEDVIVGGNHNIVSSSESVIVSGQNNSIYGLDSVIAGGQCNSIDNTTWHGSIFGGSCNSIIADVAQGNWSESATIVGGLSNNIYEHGDSAVAVGGNSNYVYAPYSATVGGGRNSAEGEGGIVVGGSGNILGNSENYSVDGFYSVLVGGECNIAKGEYTALFGGKCNVVSSCHSVVVGGYCNVAGQVYYYIDDNNKTHYIYGHSDDIYQGEIGDSSDEDYYWGNVIDVGDKTYPVSEYSAVEASVFGGAHNKSFGTDSTIVGGSTNFTEGVYSVITGGTCNTSRGYASMIAGGNCNIATGCFATVAGGKDGQAYAKYSTVIGGAIAGCLSNPNVAQHSVAIGKQAQTTQDYEVAIGSQCAPVTIGGDLTVTSKIHGVTAGTADTDAVNVGQMNQALADLGISELDTLAIKYDSNTKERATFAGSQGTVLGNLKAGAISATSMEAINGSQLYAVKQDIAGFATDIARNSENIRTMNASVTSALSSVAASGLLVDTMDATKADSSLNNLTDSGKRVLKQYAETAVQEYMAAQQGSNSAPMAPMAPSITNSNTLTVTNAGNGSLHVGEGSYVNGTSSIAIGVGNQVNANNSGAFGDPSIINADASYVLGNDDTINTGATGSFIVGNDGVSDAKGGLLFGSNTKATVEAEDGLALGNHAEVSAKNSIALGSGSIADTENTVSVGNDTLKRRITNVAEGNITEDSSDVVTGSQLFITNEKVQKNTEAIEKKADANASNIDVKEWAAKLGVGKVENGNTDLVTGGAVYDAMKDIKTASDFVKESNGIISIAPNSTATKIDIKNSSGEGRVITGVVTDVNDVSSAANVGYVNSVATNVANEVNRGFNKMNDRIDKVGAGAAAMAGLVPGPMDGDEKWSISAAVGNYRSATAGAVGAFYKPTDNVMVAVKGSFGSDENMVSGGVGISLNKGNVPGVSKAQMVRTINAQAGQIQQQANEIQNMKVAHQAEISNLQAQISALAAKVSEMQK